MASKKSTGSKYGDKTRADWERTEPIRQKRKSTGSPFGDKVKMDWERTSPLRKKIEQDGVPKRQQPKGSSPKTTMTKASTSRAKSTILNAYEDMQRSRDPYYDARVRGASGERFRERGDRSYKSGTEFNVYKTSQDRARIIRKKNGK